MSRYRNFSFILVLIFVSNFVRADEGMWLLSLLDGYTIEDMQSKGFKLTAEDIYSVNKACLKDAVVIFGGGCTGELISEEGLLLTNHHCGYGSIQSQSTIENDYLTKGFWAMNRDEELPNPGLSVQFLRYMKDVSDKVTIGIDMSANEYVIETGISKNIDRIVEEAREGGRYEANVRSMFAGNQYFLFVYQRYTDVRLVGAPPSSIGNFGEDSDNWIWPRHTGDFSLFRVYASKDNQPSDYNVENIPYHPKKFLEISTSGIEKGDFTMILGYPGSTEQFLYSKAIQIMMERSLPLKIELRTKRLEIMDKYMSQSDEVRIKYASKYRGVSNAWKKWQGEIKGLERLDAVNKKIAFEKEFENWVSRSEEREAKYGDLIPGFAEIYNALDEYQVINDLLREAVIPIEIFRVANTVRSLMIDSISAEDIIKRTSGFYKDYFIPVDRETFTALMTEYRRNCQNEYYPEFFDVLDKKYKGNLNKYAANIFENSPFRSQAALDEFLSLYTKNRKKGMEKLAKDPFIIAYDQFRNIYSMMVLPQMRILNEKLNVLYKLWVQGNFEMFPQLKQYPDANFTMRLTYGKIEGYSPEDAVRYEYQTTLNGVIEKNKENKPDYAIPKKLMELYNTKDFGDYGVNGTLPVCFTASNHTSGGNSGSPVLNAEGHLIGINFDRNWEGTMSDEMYDPDMCRNISVDIRYILFILDKYAGAGYLLNEMILVKE